MSAASRPLHLFEAYGVEMEYMIVDSDTLAIKPVADQVLFSVTGNYESDAEFGAIAWSNELVLHVLEIKTNGPAPELEGLEVPFLSNIRHINEILKAHNARLLPTGAHPFMNPFSETRIWPHEYNEVYEMYNRIFDCRGHGWSNLQSTHINLPFCGDEEFARLHAAIRLILPVIPALSASTPVIESKITGMKDTRLEYYRKNQQKIPSIAGKIIPERVFSEKGYDDLIFSRIMGDLKPYDSNGVMDKHFVNSRGAIARFDRGAIEIRIIDTQETPAGDIAVLKMICSSIRALSEEKWISTEEQKTWDEGALSDIFLDIIRNGENTVLENAAYRKIFGITERCTAGELWDHLAHNSGMQVSGETDVLLSEGTLATRIERALEGDCSRENIITVYRQLAECLSEGEMFIP